MKTGIRIADIASRAINTATPARAVVEEQFAWALEEGLASASCGGGFWDAHFREDSR
ncbi:hypothetical protein [Microbacterium deminutum]|uniref:Uncharacterized protein n=1 Tax=Microbacterium deminutum TaxID=344164 RepID=A0ABP5D0Y1_9MICO